MYLNIYFIKNRRNIFESNLNKINLHNQKYNNGTVTYSQGITQFSDLVNAYLDYIILKLIRFNLFLINSLKMNLWLMLIKV